MLGRELRKYEIVHHLNGDGKDNRPENLQVMTRREHILLHRQQGDMPQMLKQTQLLARGHSGKCTAPMKGDNAD